jgi:hypothetical protein
LLQLDSVLEVCLIGVRIMVVVTGDVGVKGAVEFVANSVHSVLDVASKFGFECWDLFIP